MSGRPNQLPHVTCPACEGKAFARGIGKRSATYREVYYHCRNPDACGLEFVVGMEAVRAVKPSRYPNPLTTLPMTNWHSAANDRAANDDDRPPNQPAAGAVTL